VKRWRVAKSRPMSKSIVSQLADVRNPASLQIISKLAF
jgi:hypothetical protein